MCIRDRAYEEVLREINERDYQDMHRDIAPLREAEAAVRLDTSKLSFDESEQALLSLIDVYKRQPSTVAR